MKAKDFMYEKTGIETIDVDHNIICLDLNEDLEYNAISEKMPEMMKEAQKIFTERMKEA
jgi:hypothetical protein